MVGRSFIRKRPVGESLRRCRGCAEVRVMGPGVRELSSL